MIDPEAQFTDEESRRIIARAADRQEEADRVRLGAGTGMSLQRLRASAAEVGIDPRYVEAAALDLVLHREAPAPATRLGLPLALERRRVVPGRVSDVGWERMVAEFRRTFGRNGMASQFGEVREWVSGNDEGTMPVTIRLEPVDEGTLITLGQTTAAMPRMVLATSGTFALFTLLIGAMVAFGALGATAVALPIAFAVLGALTGVGGWAGYRAVARRQEERFERVLDRSELIVRQLGSPEGA